MNQPGDFSKRFCLKNRQFGLLRSFNWHENILAIKSLKTVTQAGVLPVGGLLITLGKLKNC